MVGAGFAVVFISACSPSVVATAPGPVPSSAGGAGTPSPAAPTCPAPVPSTLTVSAGTVPDGKSFAFVHHFDGVALYLDPAEFFGNEEAVRQARKDGEIGPNEDLPNPFYIRNKETSIIRVPVSMKFAATVLDNQELQPHALSATQFAASFCVGADRSWMNSAGTPIPASLKVEDGHVIAVDEQYVP
jgi:hypothetical protein